MQQVRRKRLRVGSSSGFVEGSLISLVYSDDGDFVVKGKSPQRSSEGAPLTWTAWVAEATPGAGVPGFASLCTVWRILCAASDVRWRPATLLDLMHHVFRVPSRSYRVSCLTHRHQRRCTIALQRRAVRSTIYLDPIRCAIGPSGVANVV